MIMSNQDLQEYYKNFVDAVEDYVENTLPSFYFSDTYWANDRSHCRYKASVFIYKFEKNTILNSANNVYSAQFNIETGLMPAESRTQSAYHVVYLEPNMMVNSDSGGWLYSAKNKNAADSIVDIVRSSKFNFFEPFVEIESHKKFGLVVRVGMKSNQPKISRNWRPLYIYIDGRQFHLPPAPSAPKLLFDNWLDLRVDDFNDIAAMFESIESLI